VVENAFRPWTTRQLPRPIPEVGIAQYSGKCRGPVSSTNGIPSATTTVKHFAEGNTDRNGNCQRALTVTNNVPST